MSTRERHQTATPRPARPEAPTDRRAPGPGETPDANPRRQTPAERGRIGRPPRPEEIPRTQAAIVGANIRALRHRHGMTQKQLGTRMGWPTITTVCAAEGRRGGQQRGFTTHELAQLASIFHTTPAQLVTRCAHCDGHPPPGYACLSCGTQTAHPPVRGAR